MFWNFNKTGKKLRQIKSYSESSRELKVVFFGSSVGGYNFFREIDSLYAGRATDASVLKQKVEIFVKLNIRLNACMISTIFLWQQMNRILLKKRIREINVYFLVNEMNCSYFELSSRNIFQKLKFSLFQAFLAIIS